MHNTEAQSLDCRSGNSHGDKIEATTSNDRTRRRQKQRDEEGETEIMQE